MHKESLATSPAVTTVTGELSRKPKVKAKVGGLKSNNNKKTKKRKKRITNSDRADISYAADAVRPKGLLFMLRTFFASMFDPTVDGRIDRSLLSRGDTSMSPITIPSRPNTYIPGRRGRFIPGISSGGRGSYSTAAAAGGSGGGAGGSGDAAGPVCG